MKVSLTLLNFIQNGFNQNSFKSFQAALFKNISGQVLFSSFVGTAAIFIIVNTDFIIVALIVIIIIIIIYIVIIIITLAIIIITLPCIAFIVRL